MATCPDALFWNRSYFDAADVSHPREWLEALRTDNVEEAKEILQSASTKYKDFLLNGDIPTLNGNLRDPVQGHTASTCSSMEFCITKPLHAAAIFHSHAVLRLFWESGADVQQMDIWQNNVVHMLVYADYTDAASGSKYMETLGYLQGLFSEKELKSLLTTENVFSLRPLEFAALHGCISMVGVIMHTRGVYLIKEERVGYSVEQYFDLSDYELFDDGVPPRFRKSPLAFLMLVETSRIEVIGHEAVYDDPALKSWIRAKIMTNWPFVFIWFVFRICYIGLFFSASLENSWATTVRNVSDHNGNDIEETVVCSSTKSNLGSYQWYTLASISILVLVFDLSQYVFTRKLNHPGIMKLIKSRNFVAHFQFYFWVQITTCLSVVGISTCQILRSMHIAVPLTLDHMFFVIVAWGCMWGVIYFLQVLPWISIYAIAVQRMLQEFVRFVLIFIIFLCTFAISFRQILLGNTNECPKNFGTLGETVYSTFLVIINSVNFREYENVDRPSLYILHIVYVFFIAILLLNFLIATMTQSFSDVHAKRGVIIQTQRLALMMTIQFQLARPMRALYKILHRRYFVYHSKRLCLRRTLTASNNFAPTLLTHGGNYT